MHYFRAFSLIVKRLIFGDLDWRHRHGALIFVLVASLSVLYTLRWLDQNSVVKEALPKLPSVIMNVGGTKTDSSIASVSIFDEPAYLKALDHHGLNDGLCSPVLGLKVRKNKVFKRELRRIWGIHVNSGRQIWASGVSNRRLDIK